MKTVTVVLSANVNYNNQVRRKAGEELEIDEKDLEWFQAKGLVKKVKEKKVQSGDKEKEEKEDKEGKKQKER